MAVEVESIELSSAPAKSETTTVPVKTRLSYSAFRFSDVLVMQNMASFVHLFYTITYHIPPVWLAGVQPVMKFLDTAAAFEMPRPRVVEFHGCCYRTAAAFEMPRPRVVESHGCRYRSHERETPRDKLDKLVASQDGVPMFVGSI